MLCLFDLDGTLIDSEQGIFACIRYALAQMDVAAPDATALRTWIGPPLHHSFAPLLDNNEAHISAAITHYHKRFKATGWGEYAVYSGVAELIERLQKHGNQLAVVTSKPKVHALPIINRLSFGAAFERVYGPELNGAHCGKAAMIASALNDFSATASITSMIGDRRFDMEGACANAVRGIGVAWGFGSREELEQSGASAIAATPTELSELLLA
ncbi:MAG: HAD hydrolase-like protein [Rhodanobacter sp.]